MEFMRRHEVEKGRTRQTVVMETAYKCCCSLATSIHELYSYRDSAKVLLNCIQDHNPRQVSTDENEVARYLSVVKKLVLLCSSGMLTLHVEVQSRSPVVIFAKSSAAFPLEELLKLINSNRNIWGVFLKPKDQVSLNETLHALKRLNDQKGLYLPVWLGMDVSYKSFSTPGYIYGEDFIGSINAIFSAVTIAPGWPTERLDGGYTERMVQDMLQLCEGVMQEVSFQLQAVALGKAWLNTVNLMKVSPMYTLTVEHTAEQGTFIDGYHGLMAIRTHTENGVYYKLPPDYYSSLMTSIYNT